MKKAANGMSLAAFVRPNGRNERIRTSNPFVPNEDIVFPDKSGKKL